MKRYQDWPKRLSDFITAHRNMPFEWGKNDCVMFVGKAVEALTGEDHYSKYVYDSEDGAKSIIVDNGGISGLIGKALGAGHRNVLKAGRGDIVLMKLPEYTAGVVDDSGQHIVSLSKTGIVRLPIKHAWRIWSY